MVEISFWLIENGFSVLIAACDTFRAGVVERLRTHTHRLNALHPPESHGGRTMVQLYEKGYGKDAAGITVEAISYARNQGFDVVLVDTAGRMQDSTPLMTALAKLIAVNAPDLVLFVGEALVGNEAVDQLVKFNKALADHSMAQTPRLIDGIVLTKFDTIDDKGQRPRAAGAGEGVFLGAGGRGRVAVPVPPALLSRGGGSGGGCSGAARGGTDLLRPINAPSAPGAGSAGPAVSGEEGGRAGEREETLGNGRQPPALRQTAGRAAGGR
ncbi:signal recognition particle receptor subunit alpha-like [Nyctibius grandis]|uniref:signal recognition particle receptor subunit alpha-like n=1 Tax=Nyctibius grandis TaxID=48427 RepID=UPI0035BC40ED